jgi:hypothetical protein
MICAQRGFEAVGQIWPRWPRLYQKTMRRASMTVEGLDPNVGPQYQVAARLYAQEAIETRREELLGCVDGVLIPSAP